MKTAVVRKEKEKDRIDFDRLLNSCKYALRYRTQTRSNNIQTQKKSESQFSISVRLFKSKRKKKYKKQTTCTYTQIYFIPETRFFILYIFSLYVHKKKIIIATNA